MVLNPRNEQRLVLIAANFRKEVTAAVLWLLGHGVLAQCHRVVPYSFGEEVFIDLQQIIPTPEAADYMIGMAAKDSEQQAVEGKQTAQSKAAAGLLGADAGCAPRAQHRSVREREPVQGPLAASRHWRIPVRL